MKRVFIGLWPDAQTIEAIRPWSEQAQLHGQGRVLAPQHWHITLAFLGALEEGRLTPLCSEAAQWQIPVAPFKVERFGLFVDSQTLWLGSHEAHSLKAMQQTFSSLWAYLTPLGFRPEQRAFTPHISLLRRAQPHVLGKLPVLTPFWWHSAACYVMESRPSATGTDYRPLAQIPLRYQSGQK